MFPQSRVQDIEHDCSEELVQLEESQGATEMRVTEMETEPSQCITNQIASVQI